LANPQVDPTQFTLEVEGGQVGAEPAVVDGEKQTVAGQEDVLQGAKCNSKEEGVGTERALEKMTLKEQTQKLEKRK